MESGGGVLAVGTQAGRVRLVDPATGETQLDFQAHRTAICCLSFSSNGRLASASFDKSFVIWDVDGTERLHVKGHTGQGACICEPHRLMTDDQCPVMGHARRVDAIAWNLSGERLATGGQDDTVMVWNAATGERCLVLLGHDHAVCAVAFSGDGLKLASGSCDESVRVWDARNGDVLRVLETDLALVRRFHFSSDSSKLTCAWANQNGICSRVVDLRTGDHPGFDVEKHGCGSRIIALSPDGKCTATAGRITHNSDVCVTVWKAAHESPSRLRRQQTMPGHRMGPDMSWTIPDPDWEAGGTRPMVANPGVAGCICARGDANPACESVGHSARITSLAFALDGKAVASGSIDTTCKVWEPVTGRLLRTVEVSARVSCVAFGADWMNAALRREMLVAFAMGTHPRLGGHGPTVEMLDPELSARKGCVVGVLDPDMLRLVLARV
ncbi:WD40-repeat-containing domain protein [Baffinella frigidus]|nr:WD40-repeat-containing domain protein [Cryptophyta sp. CCMP2293]